MFNDSVLAMFPGLALDVLAKATVLLIAVSLLDLAMVRRAAAMRHRLWVTAFLGLLFLPLLSFVVPEYRLAVLPAQWIAGTPTSPEKDNSFEKISQETSSKSSTNSSLEAMQLASQSSSEDMRQSPSPSASLPFAQAESEIGVDSYWSLASREFATAQSTRVAVWLPSIGLIAFVWCFGVLVAIVPLLLGMFRIRVLERCSPSISDQEPRSNLDELCQKLGIRRRVELLETNQSIVPMTWGVRRPVVLLPAAWRDWEALRCRSVLLHELAHVKRLDVLYQSIARVACSLFWFHPLAWYALSRLRVERELACDDCVLMAGERPSQYAQQLLSIALEYQSLALPPAVAIVQRSGLEKRVHAMLDQARSHLPLGPKVANGMLLFSIAFLILLAPLRLGISPSTSHANAVGADSTANIKPDIQTMRISGVVTAPGTRVNIGIVDVTADPKNWPAVKMTQSLTQSKSDESQRPVSTTVSTTENSQASSDAKADALRSTQAYVFQGKVIHPDGTPAAGASLHWVYFEQERLPDDSIPPVATTDAKGAFEIRGTPAGRDEFMSLVATKYRFGLSSSKPAILFETTGKLVSESKKEMVQHVLGMFGNDKTLQLVSDDQPLSGRILTVEGKPVANAQIRVRDISTNPAGNLDGWEKAATDSKADYVSLRKAAPGRMNGFQLPSIVRDVLTDTNGKFTLAGVGRERIVQLTIGGPGIETSIVFARARDGKTIRISNHYGHQLSGQDIYYANGFDYVATPSVPVEGRILDDATGAPLSGFVVAAGQVTFSGGGKPYIATVTDSDGRYRLSGLSQSNEDTLFVKPPRGSRYLPLGVRPKTKDARETVNLDLKLKPVALLRGRVLDKSTGKPISGFVDYFAMTKNPNLADHRAFAFSNYHRCITDTEGRYEIAVLPGEGVVTFRADDSLSYRRAAGEKTKIGRRFTTPSEMGMYETVPKYVSPDDYNFAQTLQIDSEAEKTELPIELSPGKALNLKVVDAEGHPVPNAMVRGQAESTTGWYPMGDESSTIEGYYADQGREIFAYDPESYQAAHVQLTGAQSGEIVVKLQPAGTVRGRITDKQGVAVTSAHLLGESIPADNSGNTAIRNTTDKDGRFELRGVVADYKHTVWAMIEGQGMMAIARDVSVDPTMGLDLGDIVYDAK